MTVLNNGGTKNNREKENIMLSEKSAVVYLPENVVEVTIEASVYENGRLMEVQRTLNLQEILDALREADEGYEPENAPICINEKCAVVYFPENVVEATLKSKEYRDGSISETAKKLSFSEVRDAIREADKNYIPSDATFRITEKGLKYLEGAPVERLNKGGEQ